MHEQSLSDKMEYNDKTNKGIMTLSEFNQIHGVNELLIIIALIEDNLAHPVLVPTRSIAEATVEDITNLPESVPVPTGFIEASVVTNPLEVLPRTTPLMSI